ncbi:MAG: HU family DNA-binding protein [Candidatus Azobacteroides sp.]|nr:HU family DNA-binding protein [Candidatus Azobacteroides sp.]
MKQLVSYLAMNLNISERNASEIIKATVSVLKQRLRLHEWVILNNTILFRIRKKNEKILIDPVNLKKALIPPGLTVNLDLSPVNLKNINSHVIVRDLNTLVTIQANLDDNQAALFLNTLVEGISFLIKKEKKVRIPELGTFKRILLPSVSFRKGGNNLKKYSGILFFPEASLLKEVNKPFAFFESSVLSIRELPVNKQPLIISIDREKEKVDLKEVSIEEKILQQTPPLKKEKELLKEVEAESIISSEETGKVKGQEVKPIPQINIAGFVEKLIDSSEAQRKRKIINQVPFPSLVSEKEAEVQEPNKNRDSRKENIAPENTPVSSIEETTFIKEYNIPDSLNEEEKKIPKEDLYEVSESVEKVKPVKSTEKDTPSSISALLEDAKQDVKKILEIAGVEEDGNIEELSAYYVREEIGVSPEKIEVKEDQEKDSFETEREALIRKRFENNNISAVESVNNNYLNFVDIEGIMNILQKEESKSSGFAMDSSEKKENTKLSPDKKREENSMVSASDSFNIEEIMADFSAMDAEKEEREIIGIPDKPDTSQKEMPENNLLESTTAQIPENKQVVSSIPATTNKTEIEKNKEETETSVSEDKEDEKVSDLPYRHYEVDENALDIKKYTLTHYLMLAGMFAVIFITLGYFISSYMKIKEKNAGIIHIMSGTEEESWEEPLQIIGSETVTEESDLRMIAEKYYGNQVFWVYLYEANKDIIPDVNNIEPGIEVIIPNPEAYGFDIVSDDAIQLAERKGKALSGQ